MININFPPIVQPSSRQPNRYLHVQALHSDAYKYNFFNSTIRTWNIIPNQAFFLKKTYKFYNATLIVNIFQFIVASILHYCSFHRNAQYGLVPFRVLKLKIEDCYREFIVGIVVSAIADTIRTWNIIPNQALSSANITHFKTVTRNWITPLSWSKTNSTWTPK